MKKIITAYFFLSVSCIMFSQTRIIGGTDIEISDVPWQVSLKNLKDNSRHFCGASILNKEWVLTAAHCVDKLTADQIRIHAGATNQTSNSEGVFINCDRVIIHPNHQIIDGVHHNDIALLHLSTPLSFSSITQPIRLNVDEVHNSVGTVATLTGWGTTQNIQFSPTPQSNILQHIDVPIIHKDTAVSINNSYNILTDNMIPFFQRGTSAAQGDSGGPAVVNTTNGYVLIGVCSWGYHPRSENPTVYTKVSNYIRWIYENICSISGPSTICDQATYTIQNLPQGATVQWSVSNTNLRLVSAQGSRAVFRRNGDGNSSIQASVFVGNDTIAQLNKPNIIVGNPQLGVLHFYSYNGETYWCSSHTGNRFEIEPFDNTNYTSYETCLYRIVNNTDFVQVGHSYLPMPGEIQLSGLPQGWYLFKVRGIGACGVSEWMESEVEIKDCLNNFPHPFSLSPNPANDIVTLRWDEGRTGENSSPNKDRTTQANSATYEVQLWSTTALVRKFKTDQPMVQIPLNGLPKGMYFVHVIKDGKTYRQKLIVN